MTGSGEEPQSPLTLVDIDLQRTSEEKDRDGKSGDILYELIYHKESEKTSKQGKITEVGSIDGSCPLDIRSLDSEKYSHYGIFRLRDRSTTTIIQDYEGRLYKVFSLGRNNTKVSYPVSIEEQ